MRRIFQLVFEKWPNRGDRCRDQRCMGLTCKGGEGVAWGLRP